MPIAPIDDQATGIYYEDSGTPPGCQTYTTLVLVHGAMINSATFERLLPVGPKYGIRVIIMNSRDYRGSTPYTAEELAQLASPDIETQALAVRRWGREVAQFLAYVCRSLGISPAAGGRNSKDSDGLVLATWSLSGVAALSILGDPETMGKDLTNTLAPYLRKIILYDSPSIIYGVSPDIGLTWPLVDPSLSAEQKPDAFVDWVSAYYPALPSEDSIAPDILHTHCTPLQRTPTLRTLPPAVFQRTVDHAASTRSLPLIVATDDGIRQRHARCAFFDADAVLPDVDILALWCDQSVWLTAWGAKVFQDLVRAPAEPGQRKRKTTFLKVENANHFVHWDEPERVIRLLAENCGCSAVASSTVKSRM